jgi:hypothetical protein
VGTLADATLKSSTLLAPGASVTSSLTMSNYLSDDAAAVEQVGDIAATPLAELFVTTPIVRPLMIPSIV